MPSELSRARRAARFLLRRVRMRPRIAVILGSGLGAFAGRLQDRVRIPFDQIPGFPRPTAPGHAGVASFGVLRSGRMRTIPVAVLEGRPHLYEGYSAGEVVLPVRVLAQMGVRTLILSNAAGGLSRRFPAGRLAVVRDHINLQGTNPLRGQREEFGPHFLDMTAAYSPALRRLARAQARHLDIPLGEGVYAGVLGPVYETPAEIAFLRRIGADLVGMSTVQETIAARQMGMEVLAISVVTNLAAGLSKRKLTHEEVLAKAADASEKLGRLLESVIVRIADS
ncbi:MAG TPA: purine-nucleoside phosphorylase [Terriglobales bacterium]|nr:purine-nucleoside phosphorylase [Terriglobales bacterium]